MGDIIKAEELPENEQIYLKKGWFNEWKVVHPIKIDGKMNWFNFIFGSKTNMLFLVFILVLSALGYFGVNELISNYKTIAANPCDYCRACASILR